MRYPSAFATCLTLALALPAQLPEQISGSEFDPTLNPDQQPTLEGCVQWFIQNDLQPKIYSREEAQKWCYRYHPQGALYEKAKPPEVRYGGWGYLLKKEVRGAANADNNSFKKLDPGHLSRNARDFAIRVLHPFTDVRHPPVGGSNRPVLGGFRPILTP